MNRRTLLLLPVLGPAVAACHPQAPAQTAPEQERPRPAPDELDRLFRPGERFRLGAGGAETVSLREAGTLRLPTGRLIAADPSWLPSWERLKIEAFTAAVPPGAYMVTLAMLGTLVAAARLTIAETPVARWEWALRPGQSLEMLRGNEFFGVGVDVATICLLDDSVLFPLARKASEPGSFELSLPAKHFEYVEPVSGTNMIGFEAGYGDGHYPVWVGRSAGGGVAAFAVDMLIIER